MSIAKSELSHVNLPFSTSNFFVYTIMILKLNIAIVNKWKFSYNIWKKFTRITSKTIDFVKIELLEIIVLAANQLIWVKTEELDGKIAPMYKHLRQTLFSVHFDQQPRIGLLTIVT